MADIKFKMSKARLDEMMEELHYLETVREKEVAQLIKEARSFGDLSENSEYDEAMTEQGKLYAKIAELRNLIDNAEIIEAVVDNGVVGLGSRVTVVDEEDGTEETYHIVGSQEANPMLGRISDDSPFGKGLLGKEAGARIAVDAPDGQLFFTIKDIQN